MTTDVDPSEGRETRTFLIGNRYNPLALLKQLCKRKKSFCLGARYLCQVLCHRANFLGQKGKFLLLLFIVNLNLGFCRLMTPLTDKHLLKVKITGNSTQVSRGESNIQSINFFSPVALRGELALKVESSVSVSFGQSVIERSIPR